MKRGLQVSWQEIEALTQGHVERGHRIYTSGSSGTNSAVIKAVLNQGRPGGLLAVCIKLGGAQA